MKKTISSLCAIVFVIIAATLGVHFYGAQAGALSEEESNLVFRKALEEVLETEGITAEYIAVTIEPVYDINLDQLGFIYFMQYDNTEGFAIVIKTTGAFEVAEFFMQAPNPFAGAEGRMVYVNLMMYLVYYDGYFVEPVSGAVLSEEILELISYDALSLYEGKGDDDFTFFNERIYFINRTAVTHNLAHTTPAYTAAGLPAACVPTAGASIIGYWTRFFPSLVPGFIPGGYAFGIFIYSVNPAGAQPIIHELFQRMGTTATGTNIPNFRNGMTSFVQARGRSITFTHTMSGANQQNFNFAAAQAQLRAGRPLMIFSQGFNLASIMNNPNNVDMNYWLHTGNHGMAGFGYNVVTYTLPNGTQRTDSFIRVATGVGGRRTAFFNVNFHQTQISRVYGVLIT